MTDDGEIWSYAVGGSVAAVVVGLLFTGFFLLPSRSINKKKAVAEDSEDDDSRPLSLNYHFTRRCNYQCGFCFHTAKTSFVLPIDEAKRGLQMLKEAGKNKDT